MAKSGRAKHTAVTVVARINESRRLATRASRQIFEFLNYNLSFTLQRILVAVDDIEQ
jgi:hypothetical protein